MRLSHLRCIPPRSARSRGGGRPRRRPGAPPGLLEDHDGRTLHPGVLSPPDHERPELPELVPGRQGNRLRHEGLDLEDQSRRNDGVRADRRSGLRIDALVASRRPLYRIHVGDQRRDPPQAARPGNRRRHAADLRRIDQRRAGVVAGRQTPGLRFQPAPGPLQHLDDGFRRRQARRAVRHHQGVPTRTADRLLRRMGGAPPPHLDARQQGTDLHHEPAQQARLGRILLDESGAGCRDDAVPLRGNDVAGAADDLTRRGEDGLQLVPGAAVAATLGDAPEGRRLLSADVRRLRPHQSALVTGRQPHRVHLERDRRHHAVAVPLVRRQARTDRTQKAGLQAPDGQAEGEDRRRRHERRDGRAGSSERGGRPFLRAPGKLAARRLDHVRPHGREGVPLLPHGRRIRDRPAAGQDDAGRRQGFRVLSGRSGSDGSGGPSRSPSPFA